MHKIGIYPGTFDPMTYGHMDLLVKASKVVEKLIVGVSTGFSKNPLFTTAERAQIIQSYLKEYNLEKRVEVMSFDGLLVDFACNVKANLIIRGLRAIFDFEYEFQMSCMNARLAPEIQTIFIPASEQNRFISSKLVKEIASLKGDVKNFVNSFAEERLKNYYYKTF